MFFTRRDEDCFADINGDIECVRDGGFLVIRGQLNPFSSNTFNISPIPILPSIIHML